MDGAIAGMAADLAALVEEKLGVPDRGLAWQVRRIGRRAPRRVRGDLAAVVAAAEAEQHPRVAARRDPSEALAAARRAELWLGTVDPVARRAQARRAMLAALAFNLLLATGILIAFLEARGLIGSGAGQP